MGQDQPARGLWRDIGLACLIVALSAIPYIGGLGFYSDDWSFLGTLVHYQDMGFADLVGQYAYEHDLDLRPGQAVYQAGLFRLFGETPLGWHLVNHAVIAAMAAACLVVLRQLKTGAAGAFAIAVLFVLAPNASTDRLWFAAFQIPLSALFYFVSLSCELKALQGRQAVWKAGALAAMAASLACYELTLPLFAANVLLIAWMKRKAGASWPAAIGPQLTNIAVLAAIVIYKAGATERDAGGDLWRYRYIVLRIFDPSYDRLTEGGLNLPAFAQVHFGTWGIGLPVSAVRAAVAYPSLLATLMAALVGALVWLRLRRSPPDWTVRDLVLIAVAGLVVAALGYGVFLSTDQLQFTPAGNSNRTALMSVAGLSMLFVSGVAALTRLFPGRWRAEAFALIIGGLCISASLAVSSIGVAWDQAYAKNRVIMARLASDMGPLPAGSTLLVDGVCPYEGPAPVLESDWEVEGALSVQHRVWPLEGDVVLPNARFETDGVRIALYGTDNVTRYGPTASIYNAKARRVWPLRSYEDAQAYLAVRPLLVCPRGEAGHGDPFL